MTPPKKKAKKQDFQKPGVVFQPHSSEAIQKGINQLLNAIRPTLGPLPRIVSIQKAIGENEPPEMLDSGGTIARRIIQLQDRDQDMGAMFTRHMLWNLQEKTGDGTATAGVIFQEIYNQGIRYQVAGGDPILLRSYLEAGMREVLAELDRMTTKISGKDKLIKLAESICYDPELSKVLGDIFDIISEFGRMEIRNSRGRDMKVDYVEGIYWEEGVLSNDLIEDKREGRTVIENGAVLATDLDIQEPDDILHLQEIAVQENMPGILLVASTISDRALSLILNKNNWQKVKILSVKVPGSGIDDQIANLTDLCMLTGGRSLNRVTGASLQNASLDDFGYARKVWAYKQSFGITSGKGDPRALRKHLHGLQEVYHRVDEPNDRDKLLKRIGRLLNGAATLWIGASSEDEYNLKKEQAERTARALRTAMMDGVLPGGGTALLSCRPILETKISQSTNMDEIAAYRILSRALEEPFRTLLVNSGYTPGQILARMDPLYPGQGFDLRNGKIVDMVDAGILDPAPVVKEAVHSAIASAALLLTTDILIHKRNPIDALQT